MSMYVCIPGSSVAWNTPARKVSDSSFAYGGVWYTVVIPEEFDTGMEPDPANLLIVSQSELFETEQPEPEGVAPVEATDEDTASVTEDDSDESTSDPYRSSSKKGKSKAKPRY